MKLCLRVALFYRLIEIFKCLCCILGHIVSIQVFQCQFDHRLRVAKFCCFFQKCNAFVMIDRHAKAIVIAHGQVKRCIDVGFKFLFHPFDGFLEKFLGAGLVFLHPESIFIAMPHVIKCLCMVFLCCFSPKFHRLIAVFGQMVTIEIASSHKILGRGMPSFGHSDKFLHLICADIAPCDRILENSVLCGTCHGTHPQTPNEQKSYIPHHLTIIIKKAFSLLLPHLKSHLRKQCRDSNEKAVFLFDYLPSRII